jgi:hypothetical protein
VLQPEGAQGADMSAPYRTTTLVRPAFPAES